MRTKGQVRVELVYFVFLRQNTLRRFLNYLSQSCTADSIPPMIFEFLIFSFDIFRCKEMHFLFFDAHIHFDKKSYCPLAHSSSLVT